MLNWILSWHRPRITHLIPWSGFDAHVNATGGLPRRLAAVGIAVIEEGGKQRIEGVIVEAGQLKLTSQLYHETVSYLPDTPPEGWE